MFRFSGFLRDTRQQTALLTVALSVSLLVGCRSTGSRSVANTPTSATPPPLLLGTDAPSAAPLPEAAQAFCPITPETFTTPKTGTPTGEPILQKKIDDLNAKVSELEKKLADKDKELKHALQPAPAAPKTTSAAPLPLPKIPPVLPTINVPGVTAAVDGEKVRIQIPDSVLFLPGTMRLTANGEDALRSIVAEIRTKYPQAALDIEGHTDNLQTDPANSIQKHELASLKSQVVLQYFLQSLQWDPEIVASSGYGPNRPIADNETPEGRALNNRIELSIRSSGFGIRGSE